MFKVEEGLYVRNFGALIVGEIQLFVDFLCLKQTSLLILLFKYLKIEE